MGGSYPGKRRSGTTKNDRCQLYRVSAVCLGIAIVSATSDQRTDKSGDGLRDELRAEIDRASAPSSPVRYPIHAITSRSPFAPRLTRRGRLFRAVSIALAPLLALAIILNGFPAAHGAATAWLARLRPVPGAATGQYGDQFYLLPNPPGSTVLLDNQPLARVPVPTDPRPLRLAPGGHTFAWESNAFPFQPLRCRLSVPHVAGDTCQVAVPGAGSKGEPSHRQAPAIPIITTHLSLAALSPKQATALQAAIQATLASASVTAAVRPGEHYLASASARPVVATQPLAATLGLQPLPFDGPDPCFPLGAAHPCYFPGQDCGLLCTYDGPGIIYSGVEPVWVAGMLTRLIWDYAAADGTLFARYVTQYGYGIQLVMLGILWDGATWHALALLGHRAALPPSDDLLCDSAFAWLVDGPFGYLLAANSPYDVTIRCVSSPNLADGCAISVVGNSRAAEPAVPGDGRALFLERFGVLLAASDAAHTLWPALPQADAAEQALAQDLAARVG